MPSPRERGQVLILIDQHASNECIRVERFLSDLCSGFLRGNGEHADLDVQTKAFSPPLPMLLTLHEAQWSSESSDLRGQRSQSIPKEIGDKVTST
ncbi:hypothetical protein H2248_006654 [Termitomyces sp. 'cryptogamus']|nr:hypothetical protein H2248_006654 [Termitomyces sp. 'cryptogamus']